jgi:hypothetical protein
MTKSKKRVTNRELLIELVKYNASINAHLHTLFAMQCHLFAHLTKSPVAPIMDEWSEFRVKLIQQNLDDLTDQFKGRE